MTNLIRPATRFLGAIWERVSEGHFSLVAAGVAFYAMFAVFPGLAALVAVWGMLADPLVITEYLGVVERFVPPEVGKLVHDQVMGLVLAPRSTLGWATFVSLAVALYSARAGVSGLVGGLNMVHRAGTRGWLAGLAWDFGLTLALIAALVAALLTAVVVPVLLSWLQLSYFAPVLSRLIPWATMFVMVLLCLAILFRYGPNVAYHLRSPFFSWGVIFAALAWAAVSMGFSLYLENFNSYNRIYGSIGAVVILMMWLYLSVWAVLVGGAINAELDQRRVILRQMGKDRPIGSGPFKVRRGG